MNERRAYSNASKASIKERFNHQVPLSAIVTMNVSGYAKEVATILGGFVSTLGKVSMMLHRAKATRHNHGIPIDVTRNV
tara:strand:+ start:2219 stop:2455 length:237 start_codon:yes stop_codon:yes gene_type:complete